MKDVVNRAQHRVVSSDGTVKGYIIKRKYTKDMEKLLFMNTYNTIKSIDDIANLELTDEDEIKATEVLTDISLLDINKYKYERIVSNNRLVRHIQEDLMEWKDRSGHSVLQLQGSRQTGKTTELLKFAYDNYENVVYVNMADDKHGFSDISKAYDILDFLFMYCMKNNLTFTDDHSTIIIIDEIQCSSDVYNCIRPMDNELNCDIIVTGSYLGYTLNKEFFKPAGNIEYMKMYSLSFREFCKAYDMEDMLMDISLSGKSDTQDYDKLYEKYDIYRKIGGYPKVVSEYMKTGSMENCMNLLAGLVDTFQAESGAYFSDSGESLVFSGIYQTVLRGMCRNKKGSGSVLLKDILDHNKKAFVTTKEVNRAVSWLVDSDILGACDLYDGELKDILSSRKLYFMDCGIAYYMSGITKGVEQSNIEGILSENFAYCEFIKLYHKRYGSAKVIGHNPCFMVYHNYELDFVIDSFKKNSYGIEIKTNDGSARSLKVIMEKGMLDMGVVAKRTAGGDSSSDRGIITIPIFAVGARFPYGME